MARVELGKITHLSPAAVTGITKDLIQEGLLHEIEDPDSHPETARRGRPRVLLDINGDAGKIVAAIVTADQIDLHLANFKGEKLYHQSISSDLLKLDGEAFDEKLQESINDFLRKRRVARKHLLSIGVTIQGMVDTDAGSLFWSPVLSFEHHDVTGPLKRKFKCPVSLLNDANAIALSLRARPENQELQNFACIMLGIGVGMGVFINGQLYSGHSGAAAEFGHMKYTQDGPQCRCGKRGCIEAHISDYALYRDISETRSLPEIEGRHPSETLMKQLADDARGGDQTLLDWYQQAGKVLGTGVSHVINLLSPEKVIVSGSGMRSFDLMKDTMRATIENSVVESVLGVTKIECEPFHEDHMADGTIRRALRTYFFP